MGWQDDPVVQPRRQAAWEQDEIVRPAPSAPVQNVPMSAAAGVNRGIAGIAGLPVDTLLNVADLGIAGYGTATAAMGRPDLSPNPIDRSGVFGSGEYLSNRLSGLGLQTSPQGETTADRYAFAAGTGVPAGIAGGTAGPQLFLANTARGIAGGTAGPQLFLANTARGIAGGTAGQAAVEAGGGPATVASAAILGGGSPEILKGGTRLALRGGEAGLKQAQETIRTFERAGTSPSLGQATESRPWRAFESVLSKLPGGAGVMESRAQRQQGQLGQGVDNLAGGLSPSQSATSAGRRIVQGVEDVFLPEVRATQSKLYGELDSLIPPQNAVPVTNTYSALDKISQGIANAPALSGTKLIRNSLAEETLAALKKDAPYGGISYEALKALRTRFGEKLSEFDMSPDVPRQQLKAIYAALTEDMRIAATLNGPQAMAAFQRANNYTKAMHSRIEHLQSVIDKAGGAEKIYLSATSGTGDGATTIRTVMRSLPKEAQAAVTSAFIRRLGRANPSKQNDVGDQFSTETFLTNWAKLSPEAKLAFSGPHGPDFKSSMDALASVASNLRQGSRVFNNPSGTSGGLASITAASGAASAIATGNVPVAATILGGIAASNVAARVLTNPTFVKWAATATKAPKSALRSHIANLAAIANRTGDQDLAQLAEELNKQQ